MVRSVFYMLLFCIFLTKHLKAKIMRGVSKIIEQCSLFCQSINVEDRKGYFRR